MQPDLHRFLQQWFGAVLMTLATVVFTAFVSLPMTLEHHPGEVASLPATTNSINSTSTTANT